MKSFILVALAVSAFATPVPQSGIDCSQDGQLICIGTDQFGLCNGGKAIPQGVAAGTECVNNAIQLAGSGGGDNGDDQPPPAQEDAPPPPPPAENNPPPAEENSPPPPPPEDTEGDDAPEESTPAPPAGNNGGGIDINLVPDFGVERGIKANEFNDCKGAVEGVLIPCTCPPSREEFVAKLQEFQAVGQTPAGAKVDFPTGDSNQDKLQRINTALVVLQSITGVAGVGCPAASTTLIKQRAALSG